MATIKSTTVPSKRLAASITSSSSSIQLNDIQGWDGNDLTSSDFGSKLYAVLRNESNTQMEIIELDPTTIADSSITVNKRGLQFDGDLTTEVTANKLTWIKNETIVELGSNPPQLLEHFVRTIGDETIAGVKTFSSLPKTSAGNPTADEEFARKAYVDQTATGTTNINRIVAAGTAGETVAAGELAYFDDTDNKWKLCDANTATTVENVLLGIVQGDGTDGNAITNGVLLFGVDANQTGMTAGDIMYASDTAGEITSSAGTTEVTVGIAKSTTELYFAPRFNQQITEGQKDALAGTSGTPSSSNKYITEDDVSDDAASGKVVRATGTALPALDGSNLTNIKFANFGGDGSDGALDTSDGAVDIDLGGEEIVVKQYTSINVVTNNLTFSNPHTNGTIVILKSQGDITITATIDASNIGAPGGAAVNEDTDGNDGTDGNNLVKLFTQHTGGDGGAAGESGGGQGGAAGTAREDITSVYSDLVDLATGSGGGSGGGGRSEDGTGGDGGAGGRGGGSIFIESAGDLDFTGTIDISGENGSNGENGSGNKGGGGGGGGGGAGGSLYIFYKTATSTAGTVNKSGGTGGSGGSASGITAGGGGGGGGGSYGTASSGGDQDGDGGDGGDGADGASIIA